MGGRLPAGQATVSATVPEWVLAALDEVAAREGFESRSQLVKAMLMAALARDRVRRGEPRSLGLAPEEPAQEEDDP